MEATSSNEDLDILDLRENLRHLWAEICELLPRQRVALLLNMEEIHLLPETGIASLRDVAAALALPAEELAQLWFDLPLDDYAIAQRLGDGVTRQQVIGLRRKARERLARRMKAFEAELSGKE
jgi:hypothetical protein